MYLGFKGDELSDFTLAPTDPDAASDSTAAGTDYRFFTKLVDDDGVEHVVWGYKEFVLESPIISVEDWQNIRDYYVSNASPMADMYIQRPKHPVLEGFTPKAADLDIEPNGLVFTTLVDEVRRLLYVGRSVMEDWKVGGRPGFEETDDLLVLDLGTGKRVGRMELHTDPIELELTETGVRVSTHGKHPMGGQPSGSIIDVTGLHEGATRSRMLVKGLHRVSMHQTQDMDGDGRGDIAINTYGDGIFSNFGGKFSLLWQTPEYPSLWEQAPAEIPIGTLEGALEETALVNQVGMISSAIGDFNDDGKPDLVTLTAQGAQQITLFLNKGERKFEQSVLSQYRPSWGFNMVYAADMDGDGLTDIIAVNGDNTSGGIKPKPYHGLRIYKNNGDVTFTESYFYPMHGAIRAAIEDFDGDGDQDAAVIATWAEWSFDEPETFVYLENQGRFKFSPQSMPTENFAVWVSIDVADVNADQKPDIVLGLANWPTMIPADWTTHKVMEGREGEAPTITFLINNHSRRP
ncbi:MAG: hypothetical protein ACJAUG_001136 [Halioglobus sp.]|jgi:hypothetical protein